MTASLAQSWGVLHFVFASPTLGIGVIDPDAQPAGAGSVMIRTTDGGQDWSQVTLQNWTPTGGLTFRTPSEAFATGYLPGPSTAGQLWTSTDAGHSWRVVPGTRVPFLLYAVDFPDRLHGLAAGGHYDPAGSKRHSAPWGDGHLGDLPALSVDANGNTSPVLAPRLKMADLKGRALMIHAGGDNYADQPAPLGGGGVRWACGVIQAP